MLFSVLVTLNSIICMDAKISIEPCYYTGLWIISNRAFGFIFAKGGQKQNGDRTWGEEKCEWWVWMWMWYDFMRLLYCY